MDFYSLAKTRRTIRKFQQNKVETSFLLELVDCARLAPYAANLQPLKFMIITREDLRRSIYPYIKYAGYLPDFNPSFEESPPAFIVVLNDSKIKPTEKAECDAGAAMTTMCLAAKSKGLGTCWLGAIDREKIKTILSLPKHLDITYLLGVGYPDQQAETCDMKDSVKYYFQSENVLHVPKRSMHEVLIEEPYPNEKNE